MKSTLLAVPFETAKRYPERLSHKWRVKEKVEVRTYAQFARSIRILAAGLAANGVKRGDHVGFFVNNRYEWIGTDFALMALGAVSIPRGSDTTAKEVAFIFRHSASTFLIVEHARQLPELEGSCDAPDWESCQGICAVATPSGGTVPTIL